LITLKRTIFLQSSSNIRSFETQFATGLVRIVRFYHLSRVSSEVYFDLSLPYVRALLHYF